MNHPPSHNPMRVDTKPEPICMPYYSVDILLKNLEDNIFIIELNLKAMVPSIHLTPFQNTSAHFLSVVVSLLLKRKANQFQAFLINHLRVCD